MIIFLKGIFDSILYISCKFTTPHDSTKVLQWGRGLIETPNRDPCPKSRDFEGFCVFLNFSWSGRSRAASASPKILFYAKFRIDISVRSSKIVFFHRKPLIFPQIWPGPREIPLVFLQRVAYRNSMDSAKLKKWNCLVCLARRAAHSRAISTTRAWIWQTPRNKIFALIFLREKYFLSNFLFRKNPLTIFWKRIFGRDFFLTYALCDFLSTEHVFESTPAFRKTLSRYSLGGGNCTVAPPPLRRSLTDHFKLDFVWNPIQNTKDLQGFT